MNLAMGMSRGEAELEAALQQAEAQISRAKPGAGDPTASRLRDLIIQRVPMSSQSFMTHPQFPCPDVTLPGFKVGDYRLQPPHYKLLLEKVVLRLANTVQPGMKAFGFAYGRGDDTGTDTMNMGLSLSRALEVKTHLDAWFDLFKITAVIKPIPRGEKDPLFPPNPTSLAGRQKNRSVVIKLCIMP